MVLTAPASYEYVASQNAYSQICAPYLAIHHALRPTIRYAYTLTQDNGTENMHEGKLEPLKALEKNLVSRLEGVTRDLNSAHSADSAEQVTERENEDVLRNLQEETRLELQQVRAALKRLETGEYGVCANCGEDISPARLDALPYATLCIRCAK